MKQKSALRKSRVIPAVGIGLALVVLAGCASTPEAAPSASASAANFAGQNLVVTVYGGDTEKFVREQIVPEFEKLTGARVELAVGLSKDWVTKMRVAGKDNPPYDVLLINKVRIPGLKKAGFFEALPAAKIPNLSSVAKTLRDKGDIGVQGLFQPLGFAYRTDLVSAPPTSWDDLWDKRFQGKVCVYNPSNGAGIMTLMMLGQLYGTGTTDMDAAFSKIKELQPFKQSDFDMQTPLTRGECEVAIVDSPAAMDLKTKGAPVDFVIPSEGTFMFEQDINITSGSTVKELAYKYVDYMLSAAVQEKWANKFYVSPANTKAAISPDAATKIPVKADNMSKIHTWTDKELEWIENEGAKQITDRWNREIN